MAAAAARLGTFVLPLTFLKRGCKFSFIILRLICVVIKTPINKMDISSEDSGQGDPQSFRKMQLSLFSYQCDIDELWGSITFLF